MKDIYLTLLEDGTQVARYFAEDEYVLLELTSADTMNIMKDSATGRLNSGILLVQPHCQMYRTLDILMLQQRARGGNRG